MSETNFKYANINAKLKGMAVKRLSEEDIFNLIKQTDLKSAVYVLKTKLNDLNDLDENASRTQIEQELEKISQNDIIKIRRLLNNKEKEFFDLFISKYYMKSEEYKKCVEQIYEESKKFGKELTNMIGEKIDLLNLTYIFRLKKYYHMPEEEIRKYLIDVRHNLNNETIESLIRANTFEEMTSILQSTTYKKIVEKLNENKVENAINKYLYSKYKKIFIKSKYNICTVIAYMYLEEYQKTNIINILGGINYNLSKDEIQSKIIL